MPAVNLTVAVGADKNIFCGSMQPSNHARSPNGQVRQPGRRLPGPTGGERDPAAEDPCAFGEAVLRHDTGSPMGGVRRTGSGIYKGAPLPGFLTSFIFRPHKTRELPGLFLGGGPGPLGEITSDESSGVPDAEAGGSLRSGECSVPVPPENRKTDRLCVPARFPMVWKIG